jgi:hypothetical protein
MGQGGEEPDHGHLDPRVHDEPILAIEGMRGVVVEADDEPRQHVDAVGVDGMHRPQHVRAQVLGLAGLLKARCVRRLDADEYGGEVGRPKEAEQLLILGQVQ